MRELITITDVTEMSGDQVCIAGVNSKLECIRPVIGGGVRISHLYKDRMPVVFPSASIRLKLSHAEQIPPHIEDFSFDPATIEFCGTLDSDSWEDLLRRSCFKSVHAIFDGKLDHRRVLPGTKTRSLGTTKVDQLLELTHDSRFDKSTLRVDFKDASGVVHQSFPVNDLAFKGAFYRLAHQYEDADRAADRLLDAVSSKEHIYLRIGLARPTTIGQYLEACWVQVTGVYTYPDYLRGKNWSEFMAELQF